MDGNIKDEDLRKELLKLIEETRNQIPKKSEMKEAIIARSFIVFALGCFTGIEMYTINLFLTSKIEISLMFLGFFFVIGFLIGVYVEKIDLLNIKSKYGHLDY
jgi:pilus assembly protein TadC